MLHHYILYHFLYLFQRPRRDTKTLYIFEGFAMETNLQSNIAKKDNLDKREADYLEESPLLECIVRNLWAIVRKCLVWKEKECN